MELDVIVRIIQQFRREYMVFSRIRNSARSKSSPLALALALSLGTVVTATAIETPAFAQKKKKEKETQAKQDLTPAFIEAYRAAQPNLVEGGDAATGLSQAQSLAAMATTPDEKYVAGGQLYNLATRTGDAALRLKGMGLMLESGKVPAESVAQYNFVAGQLAYQLEDYPRSREYVLAAINAGYTENNPEIIVAETYFAQDQTAEGLRYLDQAIAAKEAAGEMPPSDWYRRGLAVAYKAKLNEQARDFSYRYARDYPSAESWGDAIVVLRANAGQYSDAEILDLVRLQRRTNTMRDARTYMEYIEAASPRRLPLEVQQVIDEGYASGKLTRDDPYVTESYELAKQRVKADEADLPQLGREADAASADLKTLMAAGDTYLSYGQPAKAEAYYRRALDKSGADVELLMNRIGIAQVDQGQYAEAQQTFDRVAGARKAIARLWSAYAAQQTGGTAAPTS